MINITSITSFIAIIAICLIFFQDIALIAGSQALYLAPFFIITVLFIILCVNHKNFINTIYALCKKTPYKYLIIFIIWGLVSSFFVGNIMTSFKCIFRMLLIYGLTIIPAIVFGVCILSKYISPKKLLKIFVWIYLFIMLYGIFHYVVQLLHIDLLANIHKLFCTKQIIAGQSDYAQFFAGTASTTVRAMSVFFEASFFGTFLFVFMPFVYKISESKLKIFKNQAFDKVFKINLIFLMWLNLLLTISPIYLVAGLIYTSVYFYKRIIHNIKRIFPMVLIGLCIVLMLMVVLVPNVAFYASSNKILTRIAKTVISFGSMEKLVENEPSLATRIISNYNGLMICLKNFPIKGTGYGNAKQYARKTLENLDIPMTPEIKWVFLVFDEGNAPPCIFYSVICQTGIVGVILLYLFIIKTILEAKKVKKYFVNNNRLLLDSSYLISINFVIVSFYWSFESYPMMWFILGILLSYILLFNTKIKKKIVATRQLLSANKEEH